MSIAKTVKDRVTLTKKAYLWLKTKSVNNTKVTINQFASAMKLRKLAAEELAIELIPTLDTEEFASTFYVFVEKNQIPKWLTIKLSDAQRAALIVRSRQRFAGVVHRQTHDRALANLYGADIHGIMSSRYQWMAAVTVNALVENDIDNNPAAPFNIENALDRMRNLGWAEYSGYYGNSSRTACNQLPNGTRIELSYSTIDFEQAEALDPAKNVLVRHIPHKDPSRNPAPEVVAQYQKQTHSLIESLRREGLLLVSTGMAWSARTKATKTSLLFIKPDDLLSSVRITLPWEYVLFREIK